MPRSEDLRARLLATFRPEAREHVERLTRDLLALEAGVPEAALQGHLEEVFRAFHTLKGAARSVGLTPVEHLAQASESVLSRAVRGGAGLSRQAIRSLYDMVGAVARLVEDGSAAVDVLGLVAELEAATRGPSREPPIPAPPPPAAAAAPGPPEAAPRAVSHADTLRVSTGRLEAVLVHAEDLLGPRLAAGARVRETRALDDGLTRCREALGRLAVGDAGGPGGAGPAAPREAALQAEAELRAAQGQLRELLARLDRDQRTLAASVDALQQEARGLRMGPMAAALEAFPRMVRDLADSQGKEVDWVAEGTALELDRKVVEALKDPLIHAVRNTVDHGIETPADRVRAGKPRRGRVALRLEALEGGRVRIRVEDDGAGVSAGRLKAAAVRLRVLSAAEAEALSDEQALELVFRSGVSTSPVITAISGHGLGLPIVRERAEGLGGQVVLESRPGEGSCLTLVVPSSVASFVGLLLRAGGQLLLLATGAVERVLRVRPPEIKGVEGRSVLAQGGRALPLQGLASLLGLAQPPPEGEDAWLPCVIVQVAGERLGLLVDEVLGEQQVVVKELRPPLGRVRGFSAAGLLDTGELALILRPADLFRAAERAQQPALPSARARPEPRPLRVLVVDDSITTRAMEKGLLESVGYRVEVAADGAEAWTALKSRSFDLLVSDVDMPRMDGFELTRRVRADRSLAELPVVLVTALESREDKERGIEVGANAYVVKSSFEQSNLLDILRRLA